MAILKLMLICIVFFYASNTSFTFGIGYFTIYRPLILSCILGLITGDFVQCITVGILLNIMFYDFASTGGSIKFDMSIITVIAAISINVCNCNSVQAIAIAFPFGIVGTFIFKYRLKYNAKYIENLLSKLSKFKKEQKIPKFAMNPNIVLFFISISSIVLIYNLIYISNKYLIENTSVYSFALNFFEIAGIGLIVNYFIYFFIKEFLKIDKNKKVDYKLFLPFVLIPIYYFLPKIVLAIYSIFVIILITKDFKSAQIVYRKVERIEDKVLSVKELRKSWSRWMNLSHATLNTYNMQAMGLNSSLMLLYRKVYNRREDIIKRIEENSSLYNVEPNIGSVAIGYQIALEEKYSIGEISAEKVDILKKSIMGMLSGLGDSFTQTVLLPVFLGLSICFMQLGNVTLAIFVNVFLGCLILCISWMGIFMGYFGEKKGIMSYIGIFKDSVFIKYGKYLIFSFFIMMFTNVVSSLINNTYELIAQDVYVYFMLTLVALVYNIIYMKKYDSIINVILIYITSLLVMAVFI